MPALVALIAVTAVWGLTFVQVKDAVELYPLFAFLAVRFAIASLALAPPAPRRLGSPGLERTTVTSAGFLTGLYVLLTPLLAVGLLRTRLPRELWLAVAVAVAGLVLLGGAPSGSVEGNTLVLLSTVAMALQIVVLERY